MGKENQKFHFPVLIYDNYCSSCSKFAKVVYNLSKKKIEILGHFDIERSTKLKELVFDNYPKDPTRMFWYIKRDKAYASRKGLAQVIIDLIKINLGLIKYNNVQLVDQNFPNPAISETIFIPNTDVETMQKVSLKECHTLFEIQIQFDGMHRSYFLTSLPYPIPSYPASSQSLRLSGSPPLSSL